MPLSVLTWSGSTGWAAWAAVVRSERVKKEAAKDRENNLGMNFSPRDQRITESVRVMEDAPM
jgi:hypothetical protein